MVSLYHSVILLFLLWLEAFVSVGAQNGTGRGSSPQMEQVDMELWKRQPRLPTNCVKVVPVAPHRPAQDCGTWTIDCATGPTTCNNACFYHYCLAGFDDNYKYADGGGEPKCLDKNGQELKDFTPNGDRSRAFSGVFTKDASPCTAHPLVQRVYDPSIQNTASSWNAWNGANLQCDEWPMAAFDQPDFQAGQWPPRNSLTCIPAEHNGNIGNQYRFFRRAMQRWNAQGDRAHERTCPGQLVKGDTFKVRFDLSGVADPASQTPHCVAPQAGQERICHNNVFYPHFYMTNYRPQGGANNFGDRPGKLSFPYLSDTMNTYRIHGDAKDLELYKVVVRRSGSDNEHFAVKVYRRRTTYRDELVSQHPGQDLAVSDNLVIKGTGGRNDLTITREQGCKISFQYGQFFWGSGDEGWNTAFSKRFKVNKDISPWTGSHKLATRNSAFQMPGAYCITGQPGTLDDSNAIEEGIKQGSRVFGNANNGETQTMCWFSGP